jgi:hypothetical protein
MSVSFNQEVTLQTFYNILTDTTAVAYYCDACKMSGGRDMPVTNSDKKFEAYLEAIALGIGVDAMKHVLEIHKVVK